MASHPDFAKQWLLQRDEGARAVAAVEAAELRTMTDAEALAASDALLSAVDFALATADRVSTSGFVEQQRWFARAIK